ncbi:hypothetical protein S83_062720, partial [Arachis hypogaea]
MSEKNKNAIKSSRSRKPSRAPNLLRSPAVDTTFTIDHIPFSTKRLKKAMKKPFPYPKKPRSVRILEV